jgi:hypothetical protein
MRLVLFLILGMILVKFAPDFLSDKNIKTIAFYENKDFVHIDGHAFPAC